MAIIVEENRKKVNFVMIGGVLAVFIFAIVIAYYLFFAPTPQFDVIVPAPLERTSQISQFDLDPSTVLDSKEFRALRKFTGAPSEGTFGRENPFLSL